jgi:hypothetical protein
MGFNAAGNYGALVAFAIFTGTIAEDDDPQPGDI